MKTLLMCFVLILSSCSFTPKLKKYPDLDEEKTEYSIAVVTVGKRWFLDQFERCKSNEVICMDPPPLALQVELNEVIAGSELPSKITIATTDHYAGDVYYFHPKNQLWLVKIKSDGLGYVMPRYARLPLYVDKKGVQVIIGNGQVSWLPCLVEPFELDEFIFFDEEGNGDYEEKGVDFDKFKIVLQKNSNKIIETCNE